MTAVSGDSSRYAGKGVEWLARMGYAAKGVVYAIVGVLAAQAAFGSGGETTGTKGAVSHIGSQPFGQVLLALVALGLIGHVIWRFTQAIKDPEQKGAGAGGLLQRAGFMISGWIYGLLALYTISLLLGFFGDGKGSGSSDLTAKLMSYQGGIWAVAIIGAIVVGVGATQFIRAYREKFKQRWKTSQMSREQEQWATRVSKWGLGARGVVFCIIGGFLIIAAWQSDPSEAKGLAGALDALAGQSYGPWLLGVVALGLICYGLYCLANARYRWISP